MIRIVFSKLLETHFTSSFLLCSNILWMGTQMGNLLIFLEAKYCWFTCIVLIDYFMALQEEMGEVI